MCPPGVHFVPAHPLAGTEYSGPDSGFSTLFENRWCLLTPTPDTNAGMVEELAEFWKRLGAKVEATTPEHHDLALAVTSHLPHLIAYNIVGTAAHLETVTQSEVIKFSASGFRDFTRIAASDPTMWRDVFLHNKDAVLDMLGRFNADLKSLQSMIEKATARACSTSSRARGRSARASWNRARTRRRRTSGGRMRERRRKACPIGELFRD